MQASRRRLPKAERVALQALNLKRCATCGRALHIDFFAKGSARNWMGVANSCGPCASRKSAMRRSAKKGLVYAVRPVYSTDEQRRAAKNGHDRRRKARLRAEDPSYRMASNIRNAVWRSLRGAKSERTFAVLGYTVEQLMRRLESTFSHGMAWSNYGEWHVDHIRPLVSFNIQQEGDAEFRRCWSLYNLQALWGPDNSRKGGRYEPADDRRAVAVLV